MAHFMLRWQLTAAAAKALVARPQDRTVQATTLFEGFGGKLLQYFFTFGEYDGLAICEFPDATAVAACSMAASATGAFSRFETVSLLTAKEAETAMQVARAAKIGGYSPPNV
ncbi:MAG TPA: GYD domain-containing protein [Acetobacteraceae bacterium]|nr:GYD domain-containing protein [Acetobacteraceae bacterium]